MKWKNVEEKLPNHMQEVLTMHRTGEMQVLKFLLSEEVNKKLRSLGVTPNGTDEGYAFCSKEIPGNCLANVTHWMELPELPE